MRIIGGEWRGRRIGAVKGRDVRPTTDRVREAWMSAMGARFDDLRVLDLFAGSGALGLETLSRGAAEVVFVERARAALRVLEANVTALGARARSRIVADDVFRALGRLEGPFDLALADPPYGRGDAGRLVEQWRRRPFAKELWLEHPSRESLSLPAGARTRRYGDTSLTTLGIDP